MENFVYYIYLKNSFLLGLLFKQKNSIKINFKALNNKKFYEM